MNEKGFTVVEVAACVLIIASVGGWIANVCKIVAALADPLTGMFILRCVGIVVAPFGAVLGYF